ncbi:MAG: hypothetical protein EXS35_13200 [Pedosphaera sp.]|nr:hypothetical protein [Pedosphaera sp.]
MKRWTPIAIAFFAGALVASVAWGVYVVRYHIEFVAGATGSLHAQAGAGEQILKYLDDPQPQKASRLAFMASNMVAGFSVGVEMCEDHYPYLHVKQRWSAESRRLDEFLRERQTRTLTNSPGGVQ